MRRLFVAAAATVVVSRAAAGENAASSSTTAPAVTELSTRARPDSWKPVLQRIHVLDAPKRVNLPSFNGARDSVFAVSLPENCPVTFGLQAPHAEHVYVDQQADLSAARGFIETSYFLKYRPEGPAGVTRNLTIYTASADRSNSNNYTISVTVLPSSESRLTSLSLSPGRLEPEFEPSRFGYYARVPEGTRSATVTLEGMDNKRLNCTVEGDNQQSGTIVLGSGKVTIKTAEGEKKGQTVAFACTAADGKTQSRYLLNIVPQHGGSSQLKSLNVVGGQLTPEFDPSFHGPYAVVLSRDQEEAESGWVRIYAEPQNQKAAVTVEGEPLRGGRSAWFQATRGEERQIQVAVEVPGNPVPETWTIVVDRRGAWSEAAKYASKLAKAVSALSIVSAADNVPTFLQSAHFMQWLSATSDLNGKPETYSAFADGLSWWLLKRPLAATPADGADYDHGGVWLPHDDLKRDGNSVAGAATALMADLGENYRLSAGVAGDWVSPAALAPSVITVRRMLAATEDGTSDLSEQQKRVLISEISAEHNRRQALRSHMSGFFVTLSALALTVLGYAIAAAIFVSRGVKDNDGRVRDMPYALHPIRFWTVVLDLAMVAFSVSLIGIASVPGHMLNSNFRVMGIWETTPWHIRWVAFLLVFLCPIGHLAAVGWVLFSLRPSVVYSKELGDHHRKDLLVARADQKLLSWLPIIGPLLSVEIRDVTPVFQADTETRTTDESRALLRFNDDNRTGGPCAEVDGFKYGRLRDEEIGSDGRQIEMSRWDAQPGKAAGTAQPLLLKDDDDAWQLGTRAHGEDAPIVGTGEELKVALGSLLSCHVYDCRNSGVYEKYPDAHLGRKTLLMRNPYGSEMTVNVHLLLKHLSNLWQMAEIPQHFWFWLPRRNAQFLDHDGWGYLFQKAHRGNFYHYLIDRVALLATVCLFLIWGETSGALTASLIASLSAALCIGYTPAAIATGTSRWYNRMVELRRLDIKQSRIDARLEARRTRWPFSQKEAANRVLQLQATREATMPCASGGWFARHPDLTVGDWRMWNHRWWFCVVAWCTGAPGVEAVKALVALYLALYSSPVGLLSNGTASRFSYFTIAVGLTFTSFASVCRILRHCTIACHRFKVKTRGAVCAISDFFQAGGPLSSRLRYFFEICWQRLKGNRVAPFDFPADVSERRRDFPVEQCAVIADEVGMYFNGPVTEADVTRELERKLAPRDPEPFRLVQTLHKSGPLGIHRADLDTTLPLRLSFREFYLGKLCRSAGMAATIHIVNHGFRTNLPDEQRKKVFGPEDDSYLTLYRDPRFLPEWGVVRLPQEGHGYVVQYDSQAHTLFLKGPGLRAGSVYRLRTVPRPQSPATQEPAEETLEELASRAFPPQQDYDMPGTICVKDGAACTSSGTLYVQVPPGKAPCPYSPVEVETFEGDRFSIDPNEVAVLYDPVCQEIVLRHRLFLEARQYRVSWTVGSPGHAVNEESVVCSDNGVLAVKLSKRGVPDLHNFIEVADCADNRVIDIDPTLSGAHRLALSAAVDAQSPVGQLARRWFGALRGAWRQMLGDSVLLDSVEAFVPCTVVQCVNPELGLFRVEPDFAAVIRSLRARLHALQAQRSSLGEHLATAWYAVMGQAEFADFWEQHGVNVTPARGLSVNPLRDVQEPCVRNQRSKIQAATPAFQQKVDALFATRCEAIEEELQQTALWAAAYNDIGLYNAQLQRDLAEYSGIDKQNGLKRYTDNVHSHKVQYESQIAGFVYPMVTPERALGARPNLSSQLRQWQRQLAVWLRAEEDAPLMPAANQNNARQPSNSASNGGSESLAATANEVVSLNRTVLDIMHALKDSLAQTEDVKRGKSLTVLHYVTDSLRVRGPYTNWRPDPMAGHLALVRIWRPLPDGTPDFKSDPVWNPCCLKLTANAIKLLLPGREDVDYGFNTPYYWSHVLGHSVQLDALEALEVSEESDLPRGASSNTLLHVMSGQLVCRLTAALPHVGDQHIRLVENGSSGHEILMKRDNNGTLTHQNSNNPQQATNIFTTSPRSQASTTDGGDTFVISLGQRLTPSEARMLPPREVRITSDREAQAWPLTFRFSPRFVEKWRCTVEAAQMDRPPFEIDETFGLSENDPTPVSTQPPAPDNSPAPLDLTYEEEMPSPEPLVELPPPQITESSRDSEMSPATADTGGLENEAVYDGEWLNYKYHGTGTLRDATGRPVYSGEWRDGKRWGRGVAEFKDDDCLWWRYEGNFVNDEICGKGRLELIDDGELARLQRGEGDLARAIIAEGTFDPTRRNQRSFSNCAVEPPLLAPAVLVSLFEGTELEDGSGRKQVFLDVRRTLSAIDHLSNPGEDEDEDEDEDYYDAERSLAVERSASRTTGAGGGVKPALAHLSPPATSSAIIAYDAARREYLPHRTRWERSVEPATSLEFPLTRLRCSDGMCQLANGSVWQGPVVSGRPSGRGVMQSPSGFRVDGEFRDGLPHGKVVMSSAKPDGSEVTYWGMVDHGKKVGRGVVTAPRLYVEGVFENDQLKDGEELVVHKFIDDDSSNDVNELQRFSGKLSRGRPDGECYLRWADGLTYAGGMSHGVRQGRGVMRNKEGRVLVSGTWKDDLPHGRVARVVMPDGTVYTGDVREGKRHGMGELYYSEKGEPLYEGLWAEDVPEGRGCLFTGDGTYEGDFKKGVRHGKGQFEFRASGMANGKPRLYLGDWANDQPHGIGLYRNELGVENTYKFSKGQLDSSSMKAYKGGMCGKVPTLGITPHINKHPISASPPNPCFGSHKNWAQNDVLAELLKSEAHTVAFQQSTKFGGAAVASRALAPPQRLRPEPPNRPSVDDSTVPGDFQTESPIKQRNLRFTVLSASGIPEPQSQPTVRIIFGESLKTTSQAAAVTTNPTWGADTSGSIVFPLRHEETAIAEVWDGTLLGSGTIQVGQWLRQNKRQSDVIEVHLFDSQKRPSGILKLQCSIVDAEGAAATGAPDISVEAGHVLVNNTASFQPPLERSNLHPPYCYVRVDYAAALPDLDIGSAIDPYVIIKIGKTQQKTSVKKKAGASPVWEEEFFLPYNEESRVVFEVWDKDALSKDDFVGRAEVELPVVKFAGGLQLYRADKKGPKPAGQLVVAVATVED